MTNTDNTGLAFGLVIAAGLSTGIGAAAVYFKVLVKLANKNVLAAGLGFSGGVMLYVSFIEIFQKSNGAFAAQPGWTPEQGYLAATLCMFGGMAFMRLISFIVHCMDKGHDHCLCDHQITGDGHIDINVPELKEPMQGHGDGNAQGHGHDQESHGHSHGDGSNNDCCAPGPSASKESLATPSAEAGEKGEGTDEELMRMGLKTAIAIAIHNFPEGLATFVATLADPAVGVTLAVAIAIHNIPEGLCVALPIMYATKSRHKAFFWALWSGVSEPIGAFLGWIIIKNTGDDLNQIVYGVLFGVVAGMMVMIVLMELIPTAYRYDPQDKVVTNSLVAGMFVMAISLCLFLF